MTSVTSFIFRYSTRPPGSKMMPTNTHRPDSSEEIWITCRSRLYGTLCSSHGRGRSDDTEQACQDVRPIAQRLNYGMEPPPCCLAAENHWRNIWTKKKKNRLPLPEDGYKLLVCISNTVCHACYKTLVFRQCRARHASMLFSKIQNTP